MTCTCLSVLEKNPLSANASFRVDPSQTKSIVRKFEADLKRRFKKTRRQIKIAIVDNDVFGLQPNKTFSFNAAPPPRSFQFERDPQKVEAFMEWLRAENDANILEVTTGTPLKSASQTAWTNTYVKASYDKGVRTSATNMRKQGARVSERWVDAAFNRPVHADAAGLIFTRTFSSLDGITKTMESQISRVLAQGIIAGEGAEALAKNITNRVDKIGITRARMLARTETVAAAAEAKLNSFEEAGAEGVEILSEFTTAGDDEVCPECEALEGKTYKIDEAHGIIPVHPSCRCTFLPLLVDPDLIDLM
jgi:SPP1 gp7 family putative phage head morphogenesis protein